jgi:hypothetical protein
MLLSAFVLGVCLSAAQAGAPGVAPWSEISASLGLRLAKITAEMKRSDVGRRLIAESSDLARRESDPAAGADGVRFWRGARPVLVIGPKQARNMSDPELTLALVRELAKASADLPFPVVEGELAAYQAEMEYALERCAEDGAFSARLRQAYAAAAQRDQAALAEYRHMREMAPDDAPVDWPLLNRPRGEIERIAYYILLFTRDPDEFYWAVESSLPQADAVHLSELEDLLGRNGPDFSSAQAGPARRYVRIGGRRYRPAVFQAAKDLAESGGVARMREALGAFDTVAATALKVKVNAWVRNAP